MKSLGTSLALSAVLMLAVTGVAQAALDGVMTSYVSGNQGTDVTVKTSDGKTHAMWFDNMKKPTFQGAQLPWCPEFPCDGWPKALILGKTRVRVYTINETVAGKSIVSPTKIELLK
jgi:hypothetical protein